MSNKIGFSLFLCCVISLLGFSHANGLKPSSIEREEMVNAAAGVTAATDHSMAFTKGYELFKKKQYRKACYHLYNYLSKSSPDEVDYEWAEFFFGISLEKCGFSHAAVDILSHLVTRKPNPKIVSYCLELFEEITRTIPFDRDLIVYKVICDQEYGFVEKKIADFVNFYQGVYDWEHGFFQWGDGHFGKITSQSYYYYKYLYQKVLFMVYHDQIDDAIILLKQILESPCQEGDFKDEVRRTLGRLLYEKGRFDESIIMYQQIEKPILEQAMSLMERAWGQYRMGNPEKAMGLLYAFEAPSFQNYFIPEYYILKSFIYKDVCHYKKALTVVQDFSKHYSGSLKNIYERGKAVDDNTLLLVILNKKKIHQTWRFLNLLEKEKGKCMEFQDKSLHGYLEKIYDLEIQKNVDYLRTQIEKEYKRMANDLLKYEEEAYLIEYEIGLDISKRVYEFHYSEAASEDKDTKERAVIYPFQGEFWNDELANYKVILRNKCSSMEEWDIYFK